MSLCSALPRSCQAHNGTSTRASEHMRNACGLSRLGNSRVFVMDKAPSCCGPRLASQSSNVQAASGTVKGQAALLRHKCLSHQMQPRSLTRVLRGAIQELSAGLQVRTVRKGFRRGPEWSSQAAEDCGPASEGQAKKTCSDCGYSKLHVDFRERASSADGRHSMCRACLSALETKRLGKELHHLKLTPAEAWERAKPCKGCAEMKEIRHFGRKAHLKDGVHVQCRACVSKQCKSLQPRMPAEMAVCIRCNEENRADEFSSSKTKVNGLSSLCKSCHREVTANLWKQNWAAGSHVFVERTKDKRCLKCREVKSTSLFYRHKGRIDGFETYCKSCSVMITMRNRSKRRQQLMQ
jgi:hypothetical protein